MDNRFDTIYFEWKQIDEVVLHACHWSKIQLFFELFKIILPTLVIILIFFVLFLYEILTSGIFIWIIIFLIFLSWLSVIYKIYRYKHNYLYVTSKRILFHWINGLFGDYVKKIHYENIRNINYFTENFVGRIFKYGTLEIQSSHGGLWDITVYHIESGKLLTHYIDKIISLEAEERQHFHAFDANYFKK